MRRQNGGLISAMLLPTSLGQFLIFAYANAACIAGRPLGLDWTDLFPMISKILVHHSTDLPRNAAELRHRRARPWNGGLCCVPFFGWVSAGSEQDSQELHMCDEDPVQPDEQAPERVLLVEDDAILTLNAMAMLSEMGIAEVSSASSVAEALALIEKFDFDCGVLDFILGDETCLPIAQRLCAAQVPVLITTGFLDLDLPEDCKTAQILGKPYRFADLKRRITNLVG